MEAKRVRKVVTEPVSIIPVALSTGDCTTAAHGQRIKNSEAIQKHKLNKEKKQPRNMVRLSNINMLFFTTVRKVNTNGEG